jgi:hypothetical protein
MSKTTGCIMKGFMWVVGIASLVYGIYFLSINTSNWPQVQAVVTSSRAGTTDDAGNVNYETWFDYEVEGVKYSGYINEYTQYNQGDKLTRYYDPKDPDSTITSQGEMGFTGCIGVVFGLFCLGAMTWGAIKARRKTETPAADTNTPS